MCGICGIFHQQSEKPVDENMLQEMNKILVHRGPDDDGVWTDGNIGLGHRRLSIIDLSKKGRQPMHYGENLVISFNGEIYNYIELRNILSDRGYRFTSHTDTEIILAAYTEWGDKCVNHFVGMWAFAIWDSNKKVLFCSRDRFGIKPFHYLYKNGSFYFASEAKALYNIPDFNGKVNITQLYRFLQLGWTIYKDETLLEEIKSLPPGHNLIVNAEQFKLTRYWDIESFEVDDRPFEEKANDFLSMFKDSMFLHMRSDVSVGACLSGGLDSSSIVSMCRHLYPDQSLKTFSAYYSYGGKYDEREYIKLLNDNKVKQYFIEPKGQELTDHFLPSLWYHDFPAGASSYLSQYFVMKLANERGIKVLLDGQGADEYLGGYSHYFFRLYANMINSFQWKKLLKNLGMKKKINHLSLVQITSILVKSLLLSFISENNYYALANRLNVPDVFKGSAKGRYRSITLENINSSKVTTILYNELMLINLPMLLHKEDRNSMAFSIESRVPFLDHRLVEFAFQTRVEDKISDNTTKRLLREALNGIMPDKIQKRRDKIGFTTPGEEHWLRGPLMEFTEELLQLDPAYWDVASIRKYLNRFRKGDNRYGKFIWRLTNFAQWEKLLREHNGINLIY
jgi:asparagine synthase (glutamine-hydrolysing)